MTATAATERPPSPPNSNDGDFGLAESIEFADLRELQQHASGEGKYTPRSIRSAPVNNHEIVSIARATRLGVTTDADNPQDLYGDPTHYQTAPAHGYYTPQPVSQRFLFENVRKY